MSAEQLQETHATAMMLARMLMAIEPADLQVVLDEFSRMDALMPFTDPTGYREVMGNIPHHRRVIGALLGARNEIARVIDEEAKRAKHL